MKVPAVLLVQGSGPTDMDETVGNNKPFLDISQALAEKGIAVLRYDKRTKVYGKKMLKEGAGNITVEDEVIEDAILAANILKNDERIDAKKVYLLGHSLGGMLAPRIDSQGGDFAGIIICAGSLRTLSDILISQNEDILGQLGNMLKKIAAKQITKLKNKFDAITAMSEEEAKKTRVVGKTYAWYFKEMAPTSCSGLFARLRKTSIDIAG